MTTPFASPALSRAPGAPVLKASGLTKTHDGDPLFTDVNLIVNAGERIGLVGPNGAGKSTLLRILAGRDRPDRGTVSYGPRDRVGYRDADIPDTETTVGAFLDAGLGEIAGIAARMRVLEHAMADSGGTHDAEDTDNTERPENTEDVLAEYAAAQDRFEVLGGWEAQARSEEVRDRLGLADLDPSRRLGQTSGGQQARLMLARLLLEQPSVLLLDEPTNHLDAAGVSWLGDYLVRYRGVVVVVTHDRAFLDRLVHRVVELDVLTDQAEVYEGGYTAYRLEKRRRRARLLADWEAQEKHHRRLSADIERTANQALRTELTTHNDRMRRYAKKVAKKAKARERRLRREMTSASWIERPEERPPLVLDFAGSTPPDQVVLTAQALVGDRGNGPLWQEFSALVRGGERVVVSGENGTGKSTLLALLAGELSPLRGQATLGVRAGVLPQVHDQLPLRMPVLDYLRRRIPLYEEDAERLLDSYLFDEDQIRRPLGTLSAGEIRRLLLACLVNGGQQLLLLDEPTNYLDFDSLDVLDDALAGFGGTVVAVSHDERFTENFRPTQHWRLLRTARGPATWQVSTSSAS
ncbi:ribosomal protection-like ABC-F family protein [Actinopolymorpha pittospori]|uniref:ATPase subunit of ABC transporter with duplicated ATPase domains n=1 Tax=Actinopolymorpha pittospori TaxID=648752 RepID=A0A927N444_9ACTN|nr:ABC-F family ATP-binding cassette domain-containing protein [Actinopolymorpha pittospori]MBE1611377.1 ATPase subunit of ABC transporter with duplicated ATPase domains [Actinopolymorpha pittospori]